MDPGFPLLSFRYQIKMDDYSTGTTPADLFDVDNELEYFSSQGALARSSDSSVSTLLSDYLDPEADHVVIVPFDGAKRALGVRKDIISNLSQDWKVPKAATSFLFNGEKRNGLYSVSITSIRFCWYLVPVVPVQRFETGLRTDYLRVLQVLDANTCRIRVLVLYPPFMTAEIQAMLPSFFADSSLSDDLQWSQIHMTLLRVAIESWLGARAAVMLVGGVGVCTSRTILLDRFL
jgi:hypothetical protein